MVRGDAAGIGFWQNKHGPPLLSSGDQKFAAWLTDNFGNILGNSLQVADGQGVAQFYRDQLFKQQG